MKTLLSMLILTASFSLMAALDSKEDLPNRSQGTDYEKEEAEILAVIENESSAFWNKDYDQWASYWVQAPHISTMDWWERDSVTVGKNGEERDSQTHEHLENTPASDPQNVVRKTINMRILGDAAWVTFDQYRKDSGETDIEMLELSRETRFMEKQDGQWKIVYVVGWL